MKSLFKSARTCGLLVLLVCNFLSCTVHLAPSYNQELVTGITAQNKATLEFFALVALGTKSTTYANREPYYVQLIGGFDALVTQANARFTPRNKVRQKANEALKKKGIPVLEEGEIPSATALERIYTTLVKMRETDQKQGVTLTEVQAFKGQIKIYMDQALTYENALER